MTCYHDSIICPSAGATSPSLGRPLRRIVLGVSEIAVGVILVAADDVTRIMTTAAGFWAVAGGTIMLLDALAVREPTG